MRSRTVLLVLLAALAGCAPGGTLRESEPPPEQPYSFFGVAVDVQRGEGYAVGPRPTALTAGAPGGAAFHVGPATIELHDGTRLTVAAGTPGGNECEGLYDPESFDLRPGEGVDPWEMIPHAPEACVLIGEATPDGEVEWFHLLTRYEPASRRP